LSLEYIKSPTSDKEVSGFLGSPTLVIWQGVSVQNLRGCKWWAEMTVLIVTMTYFMCSLFNFTCMWVKSIHYQDLQ
jgi:hypothetical protein